MAVSVLSLISLSFSEALCSDQSDALKGNADNAGTRFSRALSEREDVRTYAGFLERDLEGAVGGAAALADELVHPRLVEGAFAGLIDVDAVVVTGQVAVC
jgi:hypothetical protein